jgi:protein ImuB
MSVTTAGPRRVLVVWCPDWPGTPAAPGASKTLGASKTSGVSGTPGTSVASDAGPGAQAFERIVAVVERFCPQVEVLRPGVCALSARGPARYFGGEEELARKIAEAVGSCGFTCRVGVADGLFAAQLAAQAGQSGLVITAGRTPAFLAPHPVSALGSPELADLLPRLGIWTLGEFAALPAVEAGTRFGAPGALAHRLARGAELRPLLLRPPSTDLSVRLEFDPPAEQAEPVIFTAKTLAEQLHAGLAAKGLACVRVQVQVVCADGREITRLWRHDGLLSDAAVAERVRWQLAGWRADQGQGEDGQDRDGRDGRAHNAGIQVGGITLLRLVPDQLVRDEGRQLGLWGDAVINDRVARAAIRVQAMLGHGAVTRPVLSGGRSPAEQATLVPFGDARDPLFPADRPWPGQIPAPAPATVYPVPLQAAITDDRGTTVAVTGRAVVSAPPAQLSADDGPSLAVASWAGPWPVTERWWDPATARRCARFQLVTEDGTAWLTAVHDGRWLIEASYD